MKNTNNKTGMWECGTLEGDFEKCDGKRFCFSCGKMIRVGERAIQDRTPAPFKREIHFSYRHKRCVIKNQRGQNES